MTALLKELSNQDIDWLVEYGEFKTPAANTVLVEANQPTHFYILLEGDLSISWVQPESDSCCELGRLSAGELFGSQPWLEPITSPFAIRSLTASTVLEIPFPQLAEKSMHDAGFTARLCRASAIQMLHRLANLNQLNQLNHSSGLSAGAAGQSQFRDALTVFAELQDSDLDWMLAVGQVQALAVDTLLARQGRPLDALHILLEGALTLSQAESGRSNQSDLKAAFAPPAAEAELSRLSRGELVGEMAFINSSLSEFTIRADRDTQLFSIPQWRLAAKLLHDVQFAARFYRVLALLLANRQQTLIDHYFARNSSVNKSMNASTHASVNRSTDSQFLARIELAEARFEWMQTRIQTQFGMERQLQW